VLQELEAAAPAQGAKNQHSYPHCWRHKTPIIFRATTQWFIGMDHKDTPTKNGPTLRWRRARRRRDAVLPGLGPRPPRGDDEDPPRLVRLAPAQLGRADPLLPAQGNRRACIRARRN
jgi:hypothetical protein